MLRRRSLVLLLVVALIAVTVFVLATRRGIGLSPDSAYYVKAARHMLGREQPQTVYHSQDRRQAAHFPPLYPAVLALVSLPGFDPIPAARGLHAALFALNAVLATAVAYRVTARSLFAGAVAGTLVIFTPPIIEIHAMALTEPLFISLCLALFLIVARHLRKPRLSWILLASAVTGAALMTRYAGGALVPAVVLALLLLSKTPWRRRFWDVGVFVVCASLWPMSRAVGNKIITGSMTNRQLAFNAPSLDRLHDGLRVVFDWVLEPWFATPVMLTTGAIVVIAVVWASVLAFAQPRKIAPVLAIFAACYVALLAFSITFVDAHTPVDGRILSPMFYASVILIASALYGRSSPALRNIVGGVMIVLAVIAIARGVTRVASMYHDGRGYANVAWQSSAIMEEVRRLPPEMRIYSNGPDAVYLLTSRPAFPVPAKVIASSRLPNPQYDEMIAQLALDVQSGRAVIVHLNRPAQRRWYYPTGEELKKRLGLRPMARRNDGVIYDYVPN